MVKTCSPLAASALALLLMVATARAIRLDSDTNAALSNQLLNKSVDKGVVIKADGVEPQPPVEPSSSSGEVEEAISEEKDRTGHRMPEIHVDYYGPRGHNPRHH